MATDQATQAAMRLERQRQKQRPGGRQPATTPPIPARYEAAWGAEELEFLLDLGKLAMLEDWHAWNATRLIYADFLLDHNDARHLVARAEWSHAGSVQRRDALFTRWRVELPEPISLGGAPARFAQLIEQPTVNGSQILHFPPGTLRLSEPEIHKWGLTYERAESLVIRAIRFTHMDPRRGLTCFDCGIYRAGYLAFFDPASRAKEC